ncbi:hypothetical protein ERU19_003052 [Escherichia coli]|nr:hypothetical protein [Escherichia coli]
MKLIIFILIILINRSWRLRVAQLSNPGNGKKQVFPAPGVSVTKTGKWG